MKMRYFIPAWFATLLISLAIENAPAQTVTTPSQTAIACAYNSSLPTIATNTFGFAQCDSAGRLIIGSSTTFIGYVGGYNSNISNTPTVQNAAYSASNAIGGWQQISAFRTTTQPSGVLNYIQVASKGGSTTALTIYGFNKSSAALSSTCTDKSAFSLAAADLSSMLPGFPIILTPVISQGTTITSASQSILTSVKNTDGTPTQNLTFCAVVGGSVTPASTTDLVFNFSIAQD